MDKGAALTGADNWSLPTRLLHFGMVITVTIQLGLSLVMSPPDDDKASVLASLTFETHEVVGMIALVIVVGHWIWTLSNHADGGLRHLFPWFGEARREVIREAMGLLGGQMPEGGIRGGLPGFIHGLGMLIVSGMVITGGILFFLLPESGKFSAPTEFFAEVHEVIATLVWLYWGGHGGAALMHHMKGQALVKSMFSLTKGK